MGSIYNRSPHDHSSELGFVPVDMYPSKIDPSFIDINLSPNNRQAEAIHKFFMNFGSKILTYQI